MSDDEWGEQPHDLAAERWVLAAMLTGPRAIDAAAESLAAEHFYRPAHGMIFAAMVMMRAAGEQVDPVTLRAWIAADGDLKALGGPHGGEYLMDLFSIPAHPAGVPQYAGLIVAAAVRRVMAEEATRLMETARRQLDDPAGVLTATAERISSVATAAAGGTRRASVSLRDFMAQPSEHGEPVIPGLLDHQDRVVLVGGEGKGKTTLGHQVGFAAAAGVHPFSWRLAIAPQRVLIVDCENPQRLLRRRFERSIEVASRYPGWDPANVHLIVEPGGIDLGSPRTAFEMAEVVRRFRPDLIVAGPVYKLMQDTGESSEAMHGRITRWFDAMRSRYGCAVWLEHHAPLGSAGQAREMRPMGSGIWSRWPEFGITLKAATKAHGGADGLELGQFRGHRDEGRPWPAWITRNRMSDGWPWVANYDRDVFTQPLEAQS